MKFHSPIAICICLACLVASAAADDNLRNQAAVAMKKAAEFYHKQIAVRGGYVYYYSPDLKRRLGEGVASADQIWVQPPGTPTVGMAFLEAYQATGDRYYLNAATDAALALVYGQLKSGGWTNCIDFDPRGKRTAQYRNGQGRGRNYSSLDDDQTQSAIRLMMRVDQAHQFKHAAIRQSAQVALDALLDAQFNNGAFPQVWSGPVASQPVVEASYPDYDWRSEGRIKEYWNMYTLNDGLAGTVADTLIAAYRIYQNEEYKAALLKLGDFLILAQMPAPQPAWAQQYSYEMRPIWARKFEPCAITGSESQDVIETLIKIYRISRQEKYLKPIAPALEYLKQSRLADGRLARYYELQTNKPLYMVRRGNVYSLTHADSRLPAHYGWKIESRLEELERMYKTAAKPVKPAEEVTEQQVLQVIDRLDDQGRWITVHSGERLAGQPKFRPGDRYISSAVLSRNVKLLSSFLQSKR